MTVTVCFLLTLLLAVASGQRGFLAQMGDLMLDVDEDLTRMIRGGRQRFSPSSRQTLSQLNSNTGNIMQSMDRLNENILKGISTRVNIPDMVDVNVENQRQPVVDVSVPFLPLRVTLNAKPNDNKKEQTKINTDPIENLKVMERQQSTKENEVNANLDKEYLKNENPIIIDEFPISDRSKVIDSAHNFDAYSEESIEENDKQYYKIDEKPTKRSGSQTETSEVLSRVPLSESTNEDESASNYGSTGDSGVSGRFLGNFLYSESAFDNMMKRLIRNHGRWSMDSNLIPSRTLQTLRRITNSFLNPVPTEYDRDVLNRRSHSNWDSTQDEYIEESEYIPGADSSMYDRDERYDDWSSEVPHLRPGDRNEDLQLGLQEYRRVIRKLMSRTNFQSDSNNREIAILAFALDGKPVKVIIDSYIEDPLRYLHIMLRQQGVTLNFPVDASGREPVPFEADSLSLGRNIGLPRVLRLDLTESEEGVDSEMDSYEQ